MSSTFIRSTEAALWCSSASEAQRAPAEPGQASTWAQSASPSREKKYAATAWGTLHGPTRSAVLVADGLGHGVHAEQASTVALRVFRDDGFLRHPNFCTGSMSGCAEFAAPRRRWWPGSAVDGY